MGEELVDDAERHMRKAIGSTTRPDPKRRSGRRSRGGNQQELHRRHQGTMDPEVDRPRRSVVWSLAAGSNHTEEAALVSDPFG